MDGDGTEVGLERLPRGRHGLSRELVAENQRQRLISGVIEAVAEHGYGETTIAQITGAAQLSRRTFYEHFANKEECFAAAYEASFEYLRATLAGAAEGEDEWVERVRSGLAALLGGLAAHPDLTSFFLIAPARAGDAIAERHHQAMRELVGALVSGAPEIDGAGESPGTRESALAGGMSRLIVRKVNAGETEEVGELCPELVELILRPYVGGEEAVKAARGGG